ARRAARQPAARLRRDRGRRAERARAQEALRRARAALHGAGRRRVPAGPAEDLDGEDRSQSPRARRARGGGGAGGGRAPRSATNGHAGGTLAADLILLHAPSVFDFRQRDDVLFAYLSDSDSVNVTSIYEQYPLGFFSLRQHLREQGMRAEIVNLAALMLKHPALDVDRLLGRLHAPVFGIDLH